MRWIMARQADAPKEVWVDYEGKVCDDVNCLIDSDVKYLRADIAEQRIAELEAAIEARGDDLVLCRWSDDEHAYVPEDE